MANEQATNEEKANFSKGLIELSQEVAPNYRTPENKQIGADGQKTIESIYEEERVSWTNTIKGLAGDMRTMRKLTDVQISLYSQRAVLTDRIHSLTPTYHKLNKSYKAKKLKSSEKFKTGDTGTQARLNHQDKGAWMDVQLASLNYQLNLIKNHIEFLRETIGTLDNMIFGLKHRIELENWKNTYK